MKAGKHGIRNGTGSESTGRDDKPSKDVGTQKPAKKGGRKLAKRKAAAFGKVKL